jgi:hypothetical protein
MKKILLFCTFCLTLPCYPSTGRTAEEPLESHFLKTRPSLIAPADDEKIFSSNRLTVSPVYPNPAANQASFEYEILADNVKARIVLCNVLGNVVGDYVLSHEARHLNISLTDLPPGVYFYTLNLDGKNVATRRLIVRHN